MSATIHILNGPNLNLLGKREPEVYGHTTLAEIADNCAQIAGELGINLRFEQSNWEGQLVDWIQEARTTANGIIINPAALTHTSVAVLDALNAFDGPVVELHLSQVHKREAFRHHSYVSARADAVMAGFGAAGYEMALRYLADQIKT